MRFNDDLVTEAINYEGDLRKLVGVIPVFSCQKKKMEVLRGVLFAIETEEKKQNSTF